MKKEFVFGIIIVFIFAGVFLLTRTSESLIVEKIPSVSAEESPQEVRNNIFEPKFPEDGTFSLCLNDLGQMIRVRGSCE